MKPSPHAPRLSTLALLIASLFCGAASDAQVIADPSARGNERPVILRTANGLPQVDITAPSARGVSMNRFSQFDVDSRGVIINNGRSASSTALAGWVAANPALVAQPARVIVGEVNGALPSQINGYVEIAGNKADLILANPAGITCNGCGFIHANRVELATGSPLWNGKEVTGYAVGSGPLQVAGKGLDARGVDAVALFTQAAQINAGLWAREVQLTLADPAASSASSSSSSSTSSPSAAPKFALDVAAIGGMYANRIFLVGTAHGLGARNAGILQADTQLVVTVDGRLENSGTIDAAQVRLAATILDNVAHGQIFGDTIGIAADRLANAGHPAAAPVIAAASRVDICVRELENTDHALIFSGGDLGIGRTLDADSHASGQAERVTNRAAGIEALGDMSVSAQRFENLNNGVASEERQVGDASERQYLQPKGSTERYPIELFRWQRWSRAGQYRWSTDNGALTEAIPGLTPLPDVDGVDCDDHDTACTPTPGGAYPSTDAAWAYFQLPAPDAPPPSPGAAPVAPTMSPPQTPAPGSDPDGSLTAVYQTQQAHYEQAWMDYNAQQARHDSAVQALEQWQATSDARRLALAEVIDAYNERFEAQVIRSWTQYAVTHTEYQSRVTASDPGRLVAGCDLTITGDQLTNDQSQIIAGGKLTGQLENLTHIDALGTHRAHESGTSQTSKSRYRGILRDYHTRDWGPKLPFDPADIVTTIVLPVTVTQDHETPDSAAIDVAAHRLTADGSSLFKLNPGSGPLLATDPRLTRYRDWLSSDAMLTQLRADPSLMQKHLGDGFIEQKLVREQVAQLTGRRWLPGHTNDEQQFTQLMRSGVAQAESLQLKPGIALSAAQVSKLTADLVWLVEQDVTLADGSVQRVLVPQVYLRPRAGDVKGDGSLISADAIDLIVRDALTNAGLLAARGDVMLQAGSVDNRGTIAGTNVTVTADTDITQHGGAIHANNGATLAAGGDFVIETSTQNAARTSDNRQGTGTASRTNLDRIASVHVSGNGGLQIVAGRDVVLNAAAVTSDGSGKTTITAGRDLQLGTVVTSNAVAGVGRRDAKNFLRESTTTEVGTQVSGGNGSGGDITLSAGRDLNARAATVRSDAGTVALSATQDILVTHDEATRDFAQGTHFKHGGVLSSSASTTRTTSSRTDVLGSTVSGATVSFDAGRDVQVAGSGVVSDNGTTVTTQRDLRISAATATSTDSHYRKDTQSGLMGSGGVGVTIGSQSLSSNGTTKRSIAVGSTVGATQGDVGITAGNTVAQVGSSVIAPHGDVHVAARQIDLSEARSTETTVTETTFRQSGMTVAISNPVINAVQTAQQMAEAASNTKHDRMKALAAANTAMSVASAAQAVSAGQGTTINGKDHQIKTTGADGKEFSRDATAADKVGGIQVSVSVGNTKSDSRAVVTRDEMVASSVAARGNVTMAATGDPQRSDLAVQGSQVGAGQQVTLIADHAIKLQAAASTESQRSKHSNSSASVGVVMDTKGGVGVNVSASGGKGKADGDDLRWTNAIVSGGKQVTLQSGTDTAIKGAVVTAPQVTVASGGQLDIESLQDRSTFASEQQQFGGTATIGTASSANLNTAKSKVDSTYASVAEQSGIRAGDGGFDVKVAGDTALKGGSITSTEKAVDAQRNQFSAGGTLSTSDLENRARYEAESVSVNLGTGFSAQGALAPTGTGVGFGRDSDNAASTTTSGISDIAGDKALRTGDKESGIAAIFDAGKVQKEINAQTQITQTFSTLAPRQVASYAGDKVNEINAQLGTETDPQRRAALLAERRRWDEGGAYRVLMHTAFGGLAGDVSGAAGAGAAALAAPALSQMQANLEDSLVKAGMNSAAAKGIAANVGGLAAAGIGAVGGGATGAGVGLSVDANNRQLHPTETQWIRDKAREFAKKENISESDAIKRLTQQALRQVDMLWRAQQADGDDAAAKAFLGTNQATFVNELGKNQALFTTEGTQLLRPEMFLNSADTRFYKAFAHSGISRNLNTSLLKEFADSGIAVTGNIAQLAKAASEHPELVASAVWKVVKNLPESLVDSFKDAAYATGEGVAVAAHDELQAKLNALYGTDVGNTQKILAASRLAGAIIGTVSAAKTGTEAGEATARAIGKKLDDIAAEAAQAKALDKAKVENNIYRDGSKIDSNFENEVPLANIRIEYEQEIREIYSEAQIKLKQGASEEAVARWAVNRRDELKSQYIDMTSPDVLMEIEKRNFKNYGRSEGPTIEQLRESGKTWNQIIESASRPGGRDLDLSPPGFKK